MNVIQFHPSLRVGDAIQSQIAKSAGHLVMADRRVSHACPARETITFEYPYWFDIIYLILGELKLNNKIGKLGEDLACRFLVKHGFEVIQRNYLQKCGEIDIICKKQEKIHFVEIKSVSRENIDHVSDETNNYRPEDNIHPWKLQRLSRTIQTYLLEKGVSDETEWQFDVITVYIDIKNRVSKVNMIEDVIL